MTHRYKTVAAAVMRTGHAGARKITLPYIRLIDSKRALYDFGKTTDKGRGVSISVKRCDVCNITRVITSYVVDSPV
jgi:hypothetical protein